MPLRTMMATLPGAEGNKPPAERSGGLAGDAKRRERAARKLEQQETEAAAGIDDVSLCGFAGSPQAAAGSDSSDIYMPPSTVAQPGGSEAFMRTRRTISLNSRSGSMHAYSRGIRRNDSKSCGG